MQSVLNICTTVNMCALIIKLFENRAQSQNMKMDLIIFHALISSH